jgi:hypothetical protein
MMAMKKKFTADVGVSRGVEKRLMDVLSLNCQTGIRARTISQR